MAVTKTRTKEILNGDIGTAVNTPVTNDAEMDIQLSAPYRVRVRIQGSATLLFHAWSCEAVAEKGAAAKGSAAKKSDNIESYLPRCDDGTAGIPGSYLLGSICNSKTGAAKYRQDPRSPRKSAVDLYKAGVVSLTEIASLGKMSWDFIDMRRVTIQQSAITRSRPAFKAGWEAEFELMVLLPEYIRPTDLLDVLTNAGKLTGVGDYRPTYGRFLVTKFKVIED
jgi:hypothetical protein